MHSGYSSVELFTGAGGLALGLAEAGFRHRLLLEYNRDACATLRSNSSSFGTGSRIHEGDVRLFDFSGFRREVDLLAAGAPCQPFSIGGKHRAHNDERNLFPEVFRAVREIEPRAILIENVRGLLRPGLAEFVEFIELQLANPTIVPRDPLDPSGWPEHLQTLRKAKVGSTKNGLAYSVGRVLLNAADFGVPQLRQRVFFVAIRRDLGCPWYGPAPTHSASALAISKEVTGEYWKRHGLRRKSSAGHPFAGKWRRLAGASEPWLTVRDALFGLPDPVENGANSPYLNHVRQDGARAYPGHTGSPLDAPAKTLKAGVHGVPGGENMLRRSNGTVRYFTIREAARVQTFPDTYVFSGAWSEAMRQIGNAVPVKLAAAVGRSIRACLEDADRERQAVPLSEDAPRLHDEYVQGELADLSVGALSR